MVRLSDLSLNDTVRKKCPNADHKKTPYLDNFHAVIKRTKYGRVECFYHFARRFSGLLKLERERWLIEDAVAKINSEDGEGSK